MPRQFNKGQPVNFMDRSIIDEVDRLRTELGMLKKHVCINNHKWHAKKVDLPFWTAKLTELQSKFTEKTTQHAALMATNKKTILSGVKNSIAYDSDSDSCSESEAEEPENTLMGCGQSDNIEPEELEVDNIEPEELEVDNIEPEELEVDNIEPEELEVDNIEPEELEVDNIEPEEEEVDNIEPEEEEVDNIEPEEEEGELVSRSDNIEPGELEGDNIEPENDDLVMKEINRLLNKKSIVKTIRKQITKRIVKEATKSARTNVVQDYAKENSIVKADLIRITKENEYYDTTTKNQQEKISKLTIAKASNRQVLHKLPAKQNHMFIKQSMQNSIRESMLSGLKGYKF
jgi:hypothetical protein